MRLASAAVLGRSSIISGLPVPFPDVVIVLALAMGAASGLEYTRGDHAGFAGATEYALARRGVACTDTLAKAKNRWSTSCDI